MPRFVHHELQTSDPAAAKKFYKSLFGWAFEDMKMPDGVYMMFRTDEDGGGGGIMQKMSPDAPSAWLQYVGVDSVKKSMAKAIKLGATPLVEHQQVGNIGALGIFLDPTGAACALWEASAPLPAGPTRKASPKKAASKKAAPKKPAKKKAAPKKPAKKKAAKKK
jgi:uncharacterized protein